MFANAKKVSPKPAAAPKSNSSNRAVDMMPGWADYAALDACQKQIEGLLQTKGSALRAIIKERQIARGLAAKTAPATMEVAEGAGGGTAFFAKRGSNRAYNVAELATLAKIFDREIDEDGTLVIEGITQRNEKQAHSLAVNPAYADDDELLARIDKALSGLKGIPEDFIISIGATVETIVHNEALSRIFGHPADTVTAAIDFLCGVTLKPVYRDIAGAWDVVKKLLVPSPEETKAELKIMLEASVAADTAPAGTPRRRGKAA